MDVAKFDSSSRLILFAPHPDDEALACGVIRQQAFVLERPFALSTSQMGMTIPGRTKRSKEDEA